MANNRNLILGIGTVVAIALIAIFLVLALGGSGRDLYTDYISKGNSAYASEDYDGAIVLYKQALGENPYSEEAYVGLIKAYKSLGQNHMIGYLITRAIENNVNEDTIVRDAGLTDADLGIRRSATDDGGETSDVIYRSGGGEEESKVEEKPIFPATDNNAEGTLTEKRKSLVTGKIVDATTGAPLEGFTLIVYKGEEGGEVVTRFSAGWGEYSIELEKGEYTIVAEPPSYEGGEYEKTSMAINVNVESMLLTQNITVTPVLKRGEIRIVLEWGSSPTDLDAYLRGNSSTGSNVFINYAFRSSTDRSGTVASLDYDCRNGYGPEAITIYDVEGDYTFSVVDYMVEYKFDKAGFMSCGAVVKVYTDEGQQATIRISDCANNAYTDDYHWVVCDIRDGKVTVINTFEDTTFTPGSK